jgi:hypothetical protein
MLHAEPSPRRAVGGLRAVRGRHPARVTIAVSGPHGWARHVRGTARVWTVACTLVESVV